MSTATKQKMDVIHDMSTYNKKPMNAYMNLAKSYEQCDRHYGDVVDEMDPHVVETPYTKHFPVGVPHKLVLATFNPADGAKPNRVYDHRAHMFGGSVNNPVSRTGMLTGACDQPGCAGTYMTDGHGDHVCNVCGVIADMSDVDNREHVDDEPVDTENIDYGATVVDDYDYGTPSDAYDGVVGGKLPRAMGKLNKRITAWEREHGITRPYGYHTGRSAPPEHVVGIRMMADEHMLAMVLALVRNGVDTRAKLVRALEFADADPRAVDRALATLAGERKRLRTGKIGTPRIVATRINARVVTYAAL